MLAVVRAGGVRRLPLRLLQQQRKASEALLQRLGLQAAVANGGVFDGRWQPGQGEVVASVDPATDRVIAHVAQVRPLNRERVCVCEGGGREVV
jgi:hypothetical protein